MSNKKEKLIVVALGGNALGDTPQQQKEAVKITAKTIVNLIKQGNKVVVCHGNGPQVGMVSLAFEEGVKHNKKVPQMSLALSGAMTQGYIGLHLQQAIQNELKAQHIKKEVVTVVSQTLVDKDDKSFKNPTKPIGSFYDEHTAKELAKVNNWHVKEDAGRGWRRVVASPKPIDIIEKETIKQLASKHVVISCGGGGIPTINKNGHLTEIDAVIDKDFTSEKLAELIKADMFLILTAVDGIFLNYNKPDQVELKSPRVKELEKHIKNNQFAPGSMLPKVEAAVLFSKSKPGRVSVITSLEKADKNIYNKDYWITK